MDSLDWKYDKGSILFAAFVLIGLAALVVIAVGFLLHVGWDLNG